MIGKKIRLERIIDRNSRKTVIIPMDHGVTVGPIALGLRPGAHILTPSATVRRVINMSTLAAVDAMDVKAQTELNFVGN